MQPTIRLCIPCVTFVVAFASQSFAAERVGPERRCDFVRIDSTHTRKFEFSPLRPTLQPADDSSDARYCELVTFAAHGTPVDEGTLVPGAFFNSATLDGGHIAFQAAIEGSSRNQGIFRATNGVVTPVAIGCGAGGGGGDLGDGSGDPSPIGGTFAGFFGGTFFVPATNANGDVLFLADVDGGRSSRGLFLAHVGGEIEVVATVNGPGPGGAFLQVGAGSMNDDGVVVFAAFLEGDSSAGLFRWEKGVVTTVARAGDPAPDGGTYDFVVTESLGFLDGTTIPGGPLGDINNAGTIAFRGIASGSSTTRGIVVVQGDKSMWAASAGAAAPGGGTFFDMQAASINEIGEIAFFADVALGGGNFTAGWYGGASGSLHKVLAFGDSFDDGVVDGMAFSRNPMQTIDDDGNVVLWCSVQLSSGISRDRIVVVNDAGSPVTVAQQGNPASTGGNIGGMDAWPSIQTHFGVTVSSGTPGSPDGIISAHMVALICEGACPADLDGDGFVGGSDLAALLGAWNGNGPADLDGNGLIDAADLAILLGAWGACA